MTTDPLDTDDRLALLRELRGVVAAALRSTSSARDIAALSRRLIEVSAEIEAIEKADEPRSRFDDLIARLPAV